MLIEVRVLPLPTIVDYYHNLKGRIVEFVPFNVYKRGAHHVPKVVDIDYEIRVEFYMAVEKERSQTLLLKKDMVEFI